MLHYGYVFIVLPLILLVSETDCTQLDHVFVHVTSREVNCLLPCQQELNGSCVDDCPSRSYCDSYFHTCVGCSQHCLLCTSSNYCEQCEDDFVIVAGGVCERSCELGYYYSPYATQCLACSPNCLNCSGLNQCHNCSEHYHLHDDIARQVCILPCDNGSFYNETSDQCQGCALLCKLCVPSLGCVQCEDNYVLTDNLCVQATLTTTVQSFVTPRISATPTTTVQSIVTPTISATPTTTVQSIVTHTISPSAMQSTATSTPTHQPAKSKKHNSIVYIVGGVSGGVVAIVMVMVVIMLVVCCQKRKRSAVSKPLLQFDEEDSEDGNND